MKKILFMSLLASAFVLAQGTQLKLYDYLLQANGLTKTKSGKIGLVTVKPAQNAKDETTFGYWISNNTNTSSPFLEVKDGDKNILSVNAKDFAAKAKVENAGNKTVYTYTSGGVTVVITSDVVNDETMPLGKSVQMNVKVKSASAKSISAVMTLFGDGYVAKVGTNGISTSRVEKGKAEYPLVLIAGSAGSTVSTDNGEQKAPGRLLKITSAAVAASGEEVEVLSFRTLASTVKSFEKSSNQVKNIESITVSKKEKTELSILNSASKLTPFPGDTITYTITYHNIGTSPAQDVVISNPIPVATTYVENSAAGDKAEISIDRKKVTPPQQGDVTGVNWKVTKRINPGEEGTVSFKAIVR
ncbi:MAG: hypothetical protein ACOYNS_03555 [Bacteroidota bacterium]